MWVGEHLAFPGCQNSHTEGNALRASSFTTYFILCVLQFSALSLIAKAHLDISQVRRLEKEMKYQWQKYVTLFCLPKLLNEVSVIDSLIIYHLWCYLLSLNHSSNMPPIKSHHDAMRMSNMCYIAGVTQTDTAKPICFSHYVSIYFSIWSLEK